MEQYLESTIPLVLTYSGTDELQLAGNKQIGFSLRSEHCFVYVLNQNVQVTLRAAGQTSSGKALKGQLFLVPAQCACTLRNLSDQPVDAVVIRLRTAREQDSLESKDSGNSEPINVIGFHPIRMPQARTWMSYFLCGRNVEDNNAAQFYQLQSHLYSIASVYMQSFQKPKATEMNLFNYIEHTQEYMLEHYSETIDMEELARSSGHSSSRFYQAFRRQTGLSPLKYITKLRLDASLRLLSQSHPSIVEVAHSVGYPDEYYFSRLFKKQMGMTPTEYASCVDKKIASMSPVLMGDLSMLGITPYLSFERGWDDNPEPVLKQLAAMEPELILTGSVVEKVYQSLMEIAPVTMIHWKQYYWRERLLNIGRLFGVSPVAERWLSNYDMKVENARIQVKKVLGGDPLLLVQCYPGGFRVYGLHRKKMKDFFYDDLQITPPASVKEITSIDAVSLEEIAQLDCDHVLFLIPASTPQSECDELAYNWRRLKRSRTKKRCLFVRHLDKLNYNSAVYENLVEETVKQLLKENS
ncbi:MAG: AraC family transcriptional regulator [Candidatus Pristimantibacillus sp.]